jgi:S1-C subfamily serine protease
VKRGFPDWIAYLAVVVMIVLVVRGRRENAEAPRSPAVPIPAEEEGVGPALRGASRFDPQVMVEAPTEAHDGVGTAFIVDDRGVWLTARHVVEGCGLVGVVAGRGRVIRADWTIHPQADLAVLTTRGGVEPLPVTPAPAALRQGQRAFHIGFPQGRPGEATSRLIGRETLVVVGRGERAEPVLAWAETGRSRGLSGSLAGLSGAPALDATGRAVGVTVAEAPRRGRIYTTAPETFVQALRRAPPDSTAPGAALSVQNYGDVADDLRRERQVAQVICLAG